MTTGVQVAGSALEHDLERQQATAGDDHRGQVRSPHRAVGRQHEIGRELPGERRDGGPEVGAAALLLALDQEFEVDREPPIALQERFRHQDRDQQRSLVVGSAARVQPLVPHRRLEGRRAPGPERLGRLHVVVAVDQDGRRGRGAQPLGCDHRMAAGRTDRNPLETGRAEPLGDEPRRQLDVRLVGRLGADARDRAKPAELLEMALERRRKIGLDLGAHRPPLTLSTWPVIQPAKSEAKNSTAWTTSSAVPRRRNGILPRSCR